MEGFLPLEPPAAQLPDSALRSDFAPPRVGPITAPNWPAHGVWLSSRRRSRRSPGTGRLWVSPDGVSFTQETSTDHPGVQFVDTQGRLVMTRTRLRPPWANTFLILRAGSTRLRVRVSGFARRRVRRAIRDAGLTLREATSWTAPVSASAASKATRRRR